MATSAAREKAVIGDCLFSFTRMPDVYAMRPKSVSPQFLKRHRTAGLAVLCAALVALHAGCAGLASFSALPSRPTVTGWTAATPSAGVSSAGVSPAFDGIRITTKDDATLLFQDRRWTLTAGGIEGYASVQPSDGSAYDKDTTLSYWDVSSATSSGRTSTTKQFLLTVLGVILVIGLAALVLYAAFPVNDR